MNTRDKYVFGRRQIVALPRVDDSVFIDSVFTMISRSFSPRLRTLRRAHLKREDIFQTSMAKTLHAAP